MQLKRSSRKARLRGMGCFARDICAIVYKCETNAQSLLRNQAASFTHVSRSSSFAPRRAAVDSCTIFKLYDIATTTPEVASSFQIRTDNASIPWVWAISPISGPIRLWIWFSQHGFKMKNPRRKIKISTPISVECFKKGLNACMSWRWKDYL